MRPRKRFFLFRISSFLFLYNHDDIQKNTHYQLFHVFTVYIFHLENILLEYYLKLCFKIKGFSHLSADNQSSLSRFRTESARR